MRAITIGFIVFLAWAALGRLYYVCEIKNLCDLEVDRPTTLVVKDGDEIILEGYQQFLFPPDSFEPDINDNNQEFLDRLAFYIRQNEGKGLTITGAHLLDEREANLSGSFQENLGLARAEAIRKLLVERGVEEEYITLDHVLFNADALPEEPVSFSLYERSDDRPEDYQKLNFTFKNMTYSDANFEYNSDVFKPGKQFLAYADSVQTYLELHPEKSLKIVGHTDSIGGDAFNDDLGLRRAENAMKFFRDSLSVDNRIVYETRGRREPVAPNTSPDGSDNPEGRQKNRRVNIIIE